MQAQGEGTTKLTVQVGFDGYCKEDDWLPVHVELENTGSDLNATVRVSYTNSNNGITSTHQDVALPSTSRKEFFLYILPQGFLRNFNVSLLEGNKVLQKSNLSVNCLTSDNMLIGVLADDPSTYNILNDIKPITGFARVAQLELSDLPEKAQAWSSLDALVISNVDTGTLAARQKQALESWLGAGGKLLVTGGSRWQGTVAGLDEFLPIEINGARNVSNLSGLQTYIKDPSLLETGTVLSVGTLREGAHVLAEQDTIPLVVQKNVGFGLVYFLAADPALQPLNDWSGNADLYTALLGSQPPSPRWANRLWYGYNANQALGAISELGLPSILYITCLMGTYVLIIGPLNYFVLRRMKRRELAWVTIPVLVIIFSFLAYGSGLFYRGTTPILNRLVVAQASDGLDQTHVQALVGIYSPVRARYDFDSTENFLPQPFTGGTTGDVQSNNDWTIVQEGSNMVVPQVRVEIGGMQAIALEGSLPALPISHDLTLTVSRTTPVLSGNIVNDSEFALKDAILITPGDWEQLDELRPGQSKQVSISLAASGNGPEFYTLDPMSILNLGYDDIQQDVDAARRYALLQNVLAPDYQRNDGNWGIYLMGWVDQPVLPVGLKDKRSKTVDTMLYVHKFSPSIKYEGNELHLPISLFAWESSTPEISPYYGQLTSGGYELRFRPGIPLQFRAIKSMNFQLTSNALPNELIASAWDYETKEWVQVSYGTYNTNIPEPERYVGPNGEIRIKVDVNRSDWTEIRASYIQLVVEP